MAQKKLSNYLIYGVPILIGVYFIFRSLKAKSQVTEGQPTVDDLATETDIKPTDATSSVFPLRKGSKGNKVKELQGVINEYNSENKLPLLVVDGDFGSKTEAALDNILGKKVVSSQADIDAIRKKKSDIKVAAGRLQLANKLLDLYNKSSNVDFFAIWDTQYSKQKLTSDGRVASKTVGVLKKGNRIGLRYSTLKSGQKIEKVFIDPNGIIVGDYSYLGSKYRISFSPYGVEVK